MRGAIFLCSLLLVLVYTTSVKAKCPEGSYFDVESGSCSNALPEGCELYENEETEITTVNTTVEDPDEKVYYNSTDGWNTTTTEGYYNSTDGWYNTTTNGYDNSTDGWYNSTTDGWNNTTTEGYYNSTDGWYNTTTNGYDNSTDGWYNSTTDGWNNTTTEGYYNSTDGWYNTTTNGYDNSTDGWYNSTTDGWNNTTTEGYYNSTDDWYNTTTNGYNNSTDGWYNSTTDGWYNSTTEGYYNSTDGWYNATTEGYYNTTEEANFYDCPPEGMHAFPHPFSCSKFIKCIDGIHGEFECVDGLHFNAKWGWCDYPSEANCTIGEDKSVCSTEGRYFIPYPASCSKFIKCNDGTYAVFQCAEGLHFDSVYGWCDYPSKVNCVIKEEDTV